MIARMDAIPVEVPWAASSTGTEARAYKWAFGLKESGAAVLVRLETQDGLVGWGEATCLFHPSMPAGLIASAVESLAPLVIGQRAADVERFLASAYNGAGWHFAPGFGNYAISGVEMALWDIVGRAAGLPLCDLWGGRIRESVEFMYFVYRDEPDRMYAEARRAVAEGYRCIYMKIGLDEHDDIELTAGMRHAIGSDVRLRVDANEAWSTGMAVRMISALEDCRLEFVEQPVMAEDLAGLADVRRRVRTPICVDQAARTPHRVLDTVRAGAADIISVCPGDAGGLLLARKAAAIAEAAGIPVFIHSNIELGVATAAHIHLAASLPNCHYASQTEHQFLSGDVLAGDGLVGAGGRYAVPSGPGLGVDVDEQRVAHFHEVYLSRSRVTDVATNEAFMTSLPSY